MSNEYVLYICGGRSFRSDRPRRKMKEIVRAWRQLGYEVEHICGGDLLGSSSVADVATSKAQYYQKWYRKLSLMSPLVQSVSERRDIRCDALMLAKLRSLVADKRPVLIWERSNRLCSAGLTVAKQYRIPYVLEWKDNIIKYRFSLYHRRAVELERRKNAESDFIVVESRTIRERLIAEGLDGGKIVVALNAVDPEQFKPDAHGRARYREQLRLTDTDILVGYMGSFTWYHDSSRLVLAAKIVKGLTDQPVKFVLAGTGKDYDRARSLAEELDLLGSTVFFRPWVPEDEVPKFLSAFDIAVLPGSTDIICPIKVQEYMAMELPPIVPDYPCNREVVTDGQTGLLFRPGNEQSLAEKILLLVGDDGLRARLGKQAREQVLERFTWRATWGAALEEILGRIDRGR